MWNNTICTYIYVIKMFSSKTKLWTGSGWKWDSETKCLPIHQLFEWQCQTSRQSVISTWLCLCLFGKGMVVSDQSMLWCLPAFFFFLCHHLCLLPSLACSAGSLILDKPLWSGDVTKPGAIPSIVCGHQRLWMFVWAWRKTIKYRHYWLFS